MKTIILIVMALVVISIWIFYKKPRLEKFNHTMTFPWRENNKNILDCSIEINSKNSELYVNDKISFKIKLLNFSAELYKSHLAERRILFTMSGLEPTEHVKLIFNPIMNFFEGEGELRFKYAGNFSFQTGYDLDDPKTPSGGLFSSNLTIPILPTFQKYQIELNDRLFLQSKLTLILAIVATVLALLQLFDNRK